MKSSWAYAVSLIDEFLSEVDNTLSAPWPMLLDMDHGADKTAKGDRTHLDASGRAPGSNRHAQGLEQLGFALFRVLSDARRAAKAQQGKEPAGLGGKRAHARPERAK